MGKTISFTFLTAAKQREIASLQSALIYKQINTITSLHEKVKSLQHIIHHVKQRVQTLPESANFASPCIHIIITGSTTKCIDSKKRNHSNCVYYFQISKQFIYQKIPFTN